MNLKKKKKSLPRTRREESTVLSQERMRKFKKWDVLV